MVNLKSHTKDINEHYSLYWFSQYMKGKWGVRVGYKTLPVTEISLDKELLDYQLIAGEDCDNELFYASQGHVDYNCCPEGSDKVEITGPVRCCPPDHPLYSNIDELCYDSSTPPVPVDPIPCPCCPDGYTYNSGTGFCVGVMGSDVVLPIHCGYGCLSPTSILGPLTACAELAPDSILLSEPVLGTCPLPYQGVTWCKVAPTPVIVTRINPLPQVSIEQFTVGASSGPAVGSTTFTPLIAGRAYLIGKTTIGVAQMTVLTKDVDYTFNTLTGTITLLAGRIFNPGEVYTITSV